MRRTCPDCGMTNLPYETKCGMCGRELLAQADADAKRREWEALPPEARAEFEGNYRRERDGFLEYVAWLKKYRLMHAAIGAVAVSFVMNALIGFPSLWPILLDLILGAAAGVLLNARRGGSYRGLGLFIAAAVLTVPLLMPFVGADAYWRGWWLFSAIGLMGVGGIGYILGLKMDFEHRDRSVLR